MIALGKNAEKKELRGSGEIFYWYLRLFRPLT